MFILFLSVQRFISPETIPHTNIALVVMIISIIVNFFLVRYQSNIIKQTKSISAEAEYTHYFQVFLTGRGTDYQLVDEKTGQLSD